MGTDIHVVAEFYKDDRWHLADLELTHDRNYRAFAILTDVRNEFGFELSADDNIIPISEPRGFPDDMSPELRAKLEPKTDNEDDAVGELYLGDYSFSWVTLKELLDYDLNGSVTVSGFVPQETAKRFRETGETPNSWSKWTSLPGFERIEWQKPIRQMASLIPRLIEEISVLGDPENVRLVFGFDS